MHLNRLFHSVLFDHFSLFSFLNLFLDSMLFLLLYLFIHLRFFFNPSVFIRSLIRWIHTYIKRLEKKLDGNYTRMLRAILNKSWRQHPTRHQLYGHLPPITKTIQVRRTRHAGYCWRSRDELIRDVLLWIPTHGRAKAGRPARTYIQQLCEDTGCCPEDLPRAMNDREEWRERVRDIRAASTIWWWWWYIYCHPQSDCFVVSQLSSVARHVGRLQPGSKPAQLYVKLSILPFNQQTTYVNLGFTRHYVAPFEYGLSKREHRQGDWLIDFNTTSTHHGLFYI